MQIVRGVVDVDGVLSTASEARVGALDRGFLYGDSVFEALRTYAHRPFRLADHLERLRRSCARIRIEMPITPATLEARVLRAIDAFGEGDCYLRIMVTRGTGRLGLAISADLRPSVLIYALELSPPAPELYEQGLSVGLATAERSTDGTGAAGAKYSNYLASVLALDDVRARGAQDALWVDPAGHVLEGATSNVFMVRAGGLVTPPLSAGILEGITRRVVIELAADLGLECKEAPLTVTDLIAADEVFLTSSVRELAPVVRIDDKPIGSGAPGPVCRRLHAAYRAVHLAGV